MADVNLDGKPDLVVANADGMVAVLLGRGNGSFLRARTFKSGPTPIIGLAVADLSGDGKVDIVVTSYYSISVLLGNGNGTFGSPQTYPTTGFGADAVAVADVDRDRKPDLVVSSFCGYYQSPHGCTRGVVDVFLGNGDGTFQPSQRYDSGADFAFGVLAVDVNGDAKPDLIVANWCTKGDCSEPGAIGVGLNKAFSTTTTRLSSSPDPSVHGNPATFTATVVSVGPIQPTGLVIFKNGGTAFGSAELSSGVATLTKSNLPVGTLSITAVYQGDLQSAKSTSAVLTQVVNSPN